jgi:hypothetical protein
MLKNLLYLHGFRSSPHSYKAQYLRELFAARYPIVQWCCPQLSPSPLAAAELMLELTHEWNASCSAVIGSSLGGFYADWLSRQRGFKCVLINPACDPARDLSRYIGTQTTWHNPAESFYFREAYLAELKSLYPTDTASTLEHKLLMASTGDEVLDWQEMVRTHSSAKHYIIEGSDHGVSDFDAHVGVLIDFLDL